MSRVARLAVALAGVLVAAVSCTEPTSRTAPMSRGPSHQLSRADSVARGLIHSQSINANRTSGRALPDAISDGTAAIQSITPGTFQGFAQPATITGILAGPVNSITVVGSGASTAAAITVFSSATMRQVLSSVRSRSHSSTRRIVHLTTIPTE